MPSRHQYDKAHNPRNQPYEDWPARNRPIFRGLCLRGPDPGVFALNVLLNLLYAIAFVGFVAPQLHIAVAVFGALLSLATLVALFFAAFTEPGILPRRSQPLTEAEIANPPRVQIGDTSVPLKYCYTCNIWRPPRSTHCADCDNCVRQFDHHCPWVSNCVGERNYRYFLYFVFLVSLVDAYGFLVCLIVLIIEGGKSSLADAISNQPLATILIVVAFIFAWCLYSLCCFHLFLVSSNSTTKEFLKDQGDQVPEQSCLTNWYTTFCTPLPPSQIQLRRVSVIEMHTV